MSWMSAFRLGISLSLLQIVLLMILIGGHYTDLVRWDVVWYQGIAVNGYSVTFPLPTVPGQGSNIAFFPAFPVFASAIHHFFKAILGVDRSDISITVSGQLASLLVWTYVFKILGERGMSKYRSYLIALALAVMPAAFYLVVGYSESIFIGGILGFCYWTDRCFDHKRGSWKFVLLAIAHGFVVTSCRLLGLVVVVYPLLKWIFSVRFRPLDNRRRVGLGLALIMSLGALGGLGSFLLYSHLKWGMWNAFLESNRAAWGYPREPFAVLYPSFYLEFFVGNYSDLLGKGIGIALIAFMVKLYSGVRYSQKNLVGLASYDQVGRIRLNFYPLIVMSALLMAETLFASQMHALHRYLLPVIFMMVPVWAEVSELKNVEISPSAPKTQEVLIPVWALGLACLFLASQCLFVIKFSQGL